MAENWRAVRRDSCVDWQRSAPRWNSLSASTPWICRQISCIKGICEGPQEPHAAQGPAFSREIRSRPDGAPLRTLREFDDVITATYCGFTDASDYYARSSALRIAGEICVPTLLVAAQDDPFVSVCELFPIPLWRRTHTSV